MTTPQMLLMTGLYLAALVVVTYFTRATVRRVGGALVGGAAASMTGLGLIALCESSAGGVYRYLQPKMGSSPIAPHLLG